MRRMSLLTILMILVLLTTTMAVASANDSSHVVMVCPSGIVDDGDPANIEVHVFDQAEYATPTTVSASVFMGDEISLTEKSTGIWTGSLDAEPSMIMGEASIGEKTASNGLMMQVNPTTTVEEVEISIEPKDQESMVSPAPGDKVDFVIEIYKDGKLKDDNSLEVTLYQSGSGSDETLAKNKVSTGIYETSYTIPQLTESSWFSIEATIDDDSADYDFEVNFFQVWVKKGAISTTEASFDIYVGDLAGKAVKGAIVKLEYSYEQKDPYDYVQKDAGQGTTDDNGKAPYTVAYSKVDRDIYLDGTVEANGKTQRFSGSFIITSMTTTTDNDPPDPLGYGFEVIYQFNEGEVLKPGKSVNLEFKAYLTESYWGDPEILANADIYFYVHTYTTVIKYGKVTTDVNGILQIALKTPALKGDYDVLYFEFESETSSEWVENTEYVVMAMSTYEDIINNPEKLKDSSVQISVDKLTVGGTSKITATYAKAMKESQAQVGWLPGTLKIEDMMDYGDTQPDWEQLSGDQHSYMSKKGVSFTTNIIIPEFMPKTTYTIYVIVIDPYEGDDIVINMENYVHINYINVKAGEGGTTGQPGNEDTLFGLGEVGGIDVGMILIVLIILVVVVLVVILVARRKKGPAPPGYMPPGSQQAYGTQPVPPVGGPTQPQDHQPPPEQPPQPTPYEPPPTPPPTGGPTDQGPSEYEPPPPPADQYQYGGPPPAP